VPEEESLSFVAEAPAGPVKDGVVDTVDDVAVEVAGDVAGDVENMDVDVDRALKSQASAVNS
jgi:hypothetical protein